MKKSQITIPVKEIEHSPPHAAKSFWLHDYGAYSANRTLDGGLSCDILVVGGGIAGLSAAWHAARDTSARVVLIESEIIGYGASGRAAGWVMPQFGMDQMSIRRKYGAERSQAAFQYCRRAVRYTREIIETHKLDSDYRHPGLMRVAFDDRWIDGLRSHYEMNREFGADNVLWMDGEAVQSEYSGNKNFKAAMFDPDLGLLNPCKHVRELKGLAERAGVEIFENSPAISLDRIAGGTRVATPRGIIRADKTVIATNAYTHQLEGTLGREMRRLQAPVFARGAVTERLSKEQWKAIDWGSGNALESTLDLFHYMAPTADGRIQFYWIYYGGHSLFGEMQPEVSDEGGQMSLAHLKKIFPVLKDVRIAHNWGGHMSGTRDLVPHLCFLGDERVIYVGGCWGHGLAINHLHGQTISHMLSGRSSELTDFWIVNRQPKKWPIKPFDGIGKQLAWAWLRRRARKQLAGSIFENATARQ
tara:strand:- start:12262 stop:13680 length:1419 start_codon:yes stop_codon:yes gene_type:complete